MKKYIMAIVGLVMTLGLGPVLAGTSGGDSGDANQLGLTGDKLVVPDCSVLAQGTPSYDCRNPITDPSASAAVKRGFQYVHNTVNTIGPFGDIKLASGLPVAQRNNACSSCHFAGGQVPGASVMWKVNDKFGTVNGNDSGIYTTFTNTYRTAEDAVIGCMVACMGSTETPTKDSQVIQDIVAYMGWTAEGFPAGTDWTEMPGVHFNYPTNVDWMNMTANSNRGANLYNDEGCDSCHGDNGRGEYRNGDPRPKVPPLWGPESYTVGAAYFSVPQLATVIWDHMPFGDSKVYDGNGVGSFQNALDLAAYINTRPRDIHKSGKYYCGHHDVTGLPLTVYKSAVWAVGCTHPDEPFTYNQQLSGPWAPIKAWRDAKKAELLAR